MFHRSQNKNMECVQSQSMANFLHVVRLQSHRHVSNFEQHRSYQSCWATLMHSVRPHDHDQPSATLSELIHPYAAFAVCLVIYDFLRLAVTPTIFTVALTLYSPSIENASSVVMP